VLDDELIQLREVRNVDFALSDQLLALAQALCQRADAQGHDEHQGPDDAGSRKVARIATGGERSQCLLDQ
jgi:hypothetical protein